MLEISGISKSYGPTVVLRDVSLQVRPGEFFSLLGPSGCGKTTLLRLIAGFAAPDSGVLRLAGEDITALPPHRRACNLIFQRYALFPHLDVGGNIAFGLRLRGLPRAEIRRRVDAALALVSMSGYARRAVDALSGGQQQRIAIARALVNEPRVLLLDEPLSALDLKLRQHMQTELLALQRQLRMTFVYITHAQDEALALSDRIAVMQSGRIEQIGTPEELYDRPATPFVAEFIGQTNHFSGTLLGCGTDHADLQLAAQTRVRVPVTAPLRQAAAGARVSVFVRPESLALGQEAAAVADGALWNVLPSRLRRIVFKGDALELHADPVDAVLRASGGPLQVLCGRDSALPEVGGLLALRFDGRKASVMVRGEDA